MKLRRNASLRKPNRRNRGLRLEPLESRTLLTASPTDNSFRLAIYADSDPIDIPAEVGVQADDSTESLFTLDSDGQIYLDSPGGQKLGDFFDIWRDNAGLAGNNAEAVLSEDQLLTNTVAGQDTLQMFVNGQISTDFDDYEVQDGDQIVLVYGDNPVVSINTNFGPIVVELFETATPGTVDNFLNYVNDGDYVNSFFHRSDPDFVIQGGGFRTSSTTFTSVNQFSSVPSDPQIANEPGISNTRGTIAMAKTSDPNSATNQFFVNLRDTNAFLDLPANGAFTVFAQVLDMTTVDEIASLNLSTSNAAPFKELPLGPGNQLVVMQSVTGQGELSGVKYVDENANGQYDSGDALLAGVTVYLDANDNGVLDSGEISTQTGSDGSYRFQVESGTYVVRSELTNGRVATEPLDSNRYSETVEVGRETTGLDFGEFTLPAPSGIDLLADSDTGITDDDLTYRNNDDQASTLQFLVSGVTAGAEVRLFSDGELIGTAAATSDTVTITTDGLHTLSDGEHAITAMQILGGSSSLSTELVLTVDTIAPSALIDQVPEYEFATVGQLYLFDADSADEPLGGLSYSLDNTPDGMTIDASTGEIEWTPVAGQTGPQTYAVVITDAAGNMTSETISLTVLSAIPAYPDGPYPVLEDSVLTVEAADGVLSNDGSVSSGPLSEAEVVTQPSHGSVELAADGSFVYTPDADFFGTDTFSYKAADEGGAESNVADVTITVTAVNDAPLGLDDQYTIAEDATLTRSSATGVLANDSDVDSDDIVATLVTQPAHGSVDFNDDGSFTYEPDANYNGADEFTYKISDGVDDSSVITVSLTVTAVNDAPATQADTYAVNEDGTLTVAIGDSVLANDTDIDSEDLSAVLSSEPGHGDVSLAADGTFVYTPDADYFGIDTFTYQATDGQAASSATTVTINVSAQPDAPTAVDDAYTAPNDGTSVLIAVRANDTSAPDASQTLTITAVTQGTSGGTVTIESNSIRYTAPEGVVGEETFTYTITDSDGLTDTATVTVSIVDASDNTLSGAVYIDADGDGVRDAGEYGVPGALITLTGVDNIGDTVTMTALTSSDGSYSFTELRSGTYQISERQPTALGDGLDSTGVSGAVAGDDVISNLVVSDGEVFGENNFGEAGLLAQFISIRLFFASAPSQTQSLVEIVSQAEESAGYASLAEAIRNGDTTYDGGDNNAPVAADDSYSVDEDTTLPVTSANGALANDTDADGDTLSVTLVTDVAHGSLTLNDSGSFSYTPDENFHGTDHFTYLAHDGLADSATATVSITVDPVSDLPTSEDDSYDATEDTALTINADSGVLANDDDADGDSLSATLVDDVAHGTLSLNSNGSFVYTPEADFNGTDSFTYVADDGDGDSTEATVSITVAAVNDSPVAQADSYAVPPNNQLTVSATLGLLANDSDEDGDSLTVTVVDEPSHGTLELAADGSFVYTPETDFDGTDTFTYKANDGTADSAETTVTIDADLQAALTDQALVDENDWVY